ncbi:hypothetical protein N7508_007540 [Penicillium antarcticum]|nr:uncharacterized protein N7508_011219 [Penicillium antarcticum]XP_058318006.1 uncharacterized protein N7508_007540 [Penicillium antarcticum]KAJ5288444.1 hypothetical protein N7508_011219 [Penicillium antarcticum]KAJ5300297.1 hypothetical protein N7508_007540 [Penicillium antarcticum]
MFLDQFGGPLPTLAETSEQITCVESLPSRAPHVDWKVKERLQKLIQIPPYGDAVIKRRHLKQFPSDRDDCSNPVCGSRTA